MSPLPDQSDAGRVVAVTIGSSFSAVLTRRGDIYVAGRLGGREEGRKDWSLLHDSRSRQNERVIGVKAGLHYLTALVKGSEVKGDQRLLIWGRHSTKSPPSPHPTEVCTVEHLQREPHPSTPLLRRDMDLCIHRTVTEHISSMHASLSLYRWSYRLHY